MRAGRRIRLTKPVRGQLLQAEATYDVWLHPGTEADLVPHVDELHGRSQSRLRLADGSEFLANVLGACEVIAVEESA